MKPWYQLRKETVIGLGGLVLVWQFASYFFPVYLFPPVPAIAGKFLDIFLDQESLANAGATAGRIFAGLAAAFLLGVVLAFVMGRSERSYRYVYPLLNFIQGVPALSWVVIAIIWFKGTETRILFIMTATTLPAFSFQILDAYRSMSKDLFEMTLSFRPSRRDLFRTLILPTIIPGMLTAWKVNLGNASRVVVVAELVGATGGIGYQLLMQQQLFDMAGALAWTLVLVAFVLVVQQVIARLEGWLLAYRPSTERSA
ncbi:MAG: ABC transporter permease subunit [Burkholderiales bacterium]|nr:ABC transporter permease subunit [Burkholderiales bacterium]